MSCELNLVFHLRLISFYTFQRLERLKTGKFCQKEGDYIPKNAKANYLRPTDDETDSQETRLQKRSQCFASCEWTFRGDELGSSSKLWMQ